MIIILSVKITQNETIKWPNRKNLKPSLFIALVIKLPTTYNLLLLMPQMKKIKIS